MPQSGDIIAMYTTPGEWQELTFDMSVLPDATPYTTMVVIPNFGVIPDVDQVYYFDDITVGNGDCTTNGVFSPVRINSLKVYPNPVREFLVIDNSDEATHFALTNMLGQQVKRLVTDRGMTQVQWDMSDVAKGTYVLTALNAKGAPIARTMIIRE